MKYENFQKVKTIIDKIDKYKEIQDKLNEAYLSFQLQYHGNKIATIGVWTSCEHECTHLAVKFRDELISYYGQQIGRLHNELETL